MSSRPNGIPADSNDHLMQVMSHPQHCFRAGMQAEQPQSDQSPLPGTSTPVPSSVKSEKEADAVVQVWPGVTADAHQYGLSNKRSALQPTQSRGAKRCCESTQEIVYLSRGTATCPIVCAGDCMDWAAKWHIFDRAHSCTLHTCSVFESPFQYDPPFSASQSRWHNRFGAPEAGSMGAIGRDSLAGRDDELVCGNPKGFCMHMAPQHPLHVDSLGLAQYNHLASVPGEARHDGCQSMSEAASLDGDTTATIRSHKYFLAPAQEGNTKLATCLVKQAAPTLDTHGHAVVPSCDWHPECDALIEESYEGELQLMHRDQEASPTPASGQQKRQEEGQDGHMQQAEAGGEMCYISIGIPKPDLDQVGSVSADWPGPDTACTQNAGVTDEVSHTKDNGWAHRVPGQALVKQECCGPAAVGSPSTRDMTDNPNSVDGCNMEDKAMVHRGCLNKTLIGTTGANDCASSSGKPNQDWCSRATVAAPGAVPLSRTMGHYGKHKLSGKSGVVSGISAVPDWCSQDAQPAMGPQHAEDAPKCMLADARFGPGRCAALSELRASIYTGVRVENSNHGHASGIKLVFLEPQSAHSGDSNGNAADQEAAQRICTDFHGKCIRCWCS
eukprot:jgi/Ulvmu1/1146/UM107_0020.1